MTYCVVVQTGDYHEENTYTLADAERTARRLIEDRDTEHGTTWCSIVYYDDSLKSRTIAHVRANPAGRICIDFMK